MGHSHLPSAQVLHVRAWRNGRRARLRIWYFGVRVRVSSPALFPTPKHAVVAQLVERHLAKVEVASPSLVYRSLCGCSSMAELQPSKLATRVRFPSPAPAKSRRSCLLPIEGRKPLTDAVVAQLVERHLAKVEVASPSLVYRSQTSSGWMAFFRAVKLPCAAD